MSTRTNHQEIVKRVIEAKAIDFHAIGKVVSEIGPALSLADEPWEGFCGTMRHFIRIYNLSGNLGSPVEELGALGSVAGELKR
jgi:hypothetical protein